MEKRIEILHVFFALAALAAPLAGAAVEPRALPSGVEAALEYIYLDKSKSEKKDSGPAWNFYTEGFTHGNASFRLELKNPTRLAQPVALEYPLVSLGRHFGGDGFTLLTAYAELAPESEKKIHIPIPLVRSAMLNAHAYTREQVQLRDASGATVDFHDDFHRDLGWGTLYGKATCFAAIGEESAYGGGDFRSPFIWACSASLDTRALTQSRTAYLKDTLFKDALCAVADGAREGAASADAASGARDSRAARRERRQRNAHARPLDHRIADKILKPDFSRFVRWQELGVFDAVIIDSRDFDAFDEGFWPILADYVAAGGALFWIGEGLERTHLEAGAWGLGSVTLWDGADWGTFNDKVLAAAQILSQVGHAPRLQCDASARKAFADKRAGTPFSLVMLVLALFTVLAGPVLVYALGHAGKRIALLWVFPLISVAFSVAVGAVIIASKGVNPAIEQFAYTVIDAKAGRAVTVCHDVIIAPIGLSSPLLYDAEKSMVAYFSGDGRSAGEEITYSGGKFSFDGGWAPPLWPVAFRSIVVRDIAEAQAFAKDEDFAPLPYGGDLQSRVVKSVVEKRGLE